MADTAVALPFAVAITTVDSYRCLARRRSCLVGFHLSSEKDGLASRIAMALDHPCASLRASWGCSGAKAFCHHRASFTATSIEHYFGAATMVAFHKVRKGLSQNVTVIVKDHPSFLRCHLDHS